MDALQELVVERGTDDAVLTQLDRVLEIESRIKRTHLRMLLGLRDVLTKEQFGTAMRLRRPGPPRNRPIQPGR